MSLRTYLISSDFEFFLVINFIFFELRGKSIDVFIVFFFFFRQIIIQLVHSSSSYCNWCSSRYFMFLRIECGKFNTQICKLMKVFKVINQLKFHIYLRFQVFLSLAGIIVVTTIIAFITYNTEIPVCAILGIVIKERYVTNALSGLYFGTQVCTLYIVNINLFDTIIYGLNRLQALRWLFSLYFYDEHPEQSQPRSLSVCKIICLLLVLFCLVTIAFAYT